jgi:DNA segregation ATPase FtsK/SpoIIIE-like protein
LGQDEVDEELDKNIQGEEAAETTLSAKYKRTTRAHVKNDTGEEADETKQDAKTELPTANCIKNEFPNLLVEAPITIAETKIIKNKVEMEIGKKD